MPASLPANQHQEIHHLPLNALEAHPLNSNVMRQRMIDLLARHIRETNQYPPIIVRPLAPDTDKPAETQRYQILDGHHRIAVLRQLEHPTAQCVIWHVDDARALILLATLNQLRGADNPKRRGELLAELTQHIPLPEISPLLPEDRSVAERLIELTHKAPALKPPIHPDAQPVAVHFFLTPTNRQKLEAALREHPGPRSDALIAIVERATQAAHNKD
ncbi:ParB/RepB/Spo0J family partition protein [Mucisphaera sp.]|uniref:ParB/RepB/Spo0J family partition protein n=1 Tax=Mucisphaera sp. TaxID=2913024 RepID=UPI003D0AF526